MLLSIHWLVDFPVLKSHTHLGIEIFPAANILGTIKYSPSSNYVVVRCMHIKVA